MGTEVVERVFDDRPAVRGETPLLLGFVGPSTGGKTFSALRVASGIQRVSGGDIFVIDTEHRRAEQYADKFKFRHVAFGQPFAPNDYLAALRHCVEKRGAKIVIVDSMSHEHEGPGGVLEMHEAELERLGKGDRSKDDKNNFTAWVKPKGQRRRLINSILQMGAHVLFCFRAKEKLKITRGRDPEQRGYVPIAGSEFIYEMTMSWLLLPKADGFPTLRSDFAEEQAMIKVPEQFRGMFPDSRQRQLSEDVGEELARWAAGDSRSQSATVDIGELLERYRACSDAATHGVLEVERKRVWPTTTADAKLALKAAAEASKSRVDGSDDFELRAPDPTPRPPPVATKPPGTDIQASNAIDAGATP